MWAVMQLTPAEHKFIALNYKEIDTIKKVNNKT